MQSLKKKSYFTWLWLLPFLLLFIVLYKKLSAAKRSQQRTPIDTFDGLLYQLDLNPQQRAFAWAVAAHETGRFKSNLFVNHNNAYGMRPNQKRTKWYTGATSSNYAIYANPLMSIKDFVEWCEIYTNGVPTEPQKGAADMRAKGYYTDTLENYSKAVTFFYNEYMKQ